ncbi:MAG: hypothetical protein JSS66_18775 [Armatimonadetes bacterium]|nr:hypothetical protein [Armatimonadota bacterium]
MRIGLPGVVIALLLAFGCGSPRPVAKPAGTKKADALTSVASKDGTFTVPIPPGWVSADPAQPDVKALIEKNPNSPAAQMIRMARDIEVLQVMVFDLPSAQGGSSFTSNLNVVVLPATGVKAGTPAEDLAKTAAKGQFPSGAKTSTITTPYGKAGKYWGSTTIGTGQQHDLMGAVLLHDGRVYQFTLSTRPGLAVALSETFDKIVSGTVFKAKAL